MNHQDLCTLLHIWRGRAPGEIQFVPNWKNSGFDFFFLDYGNLSIGKAEEPNMGDNGYLLMWIIHCIEKRGWNWSLSSSHDKDYKEVWGQISFNPEVDSAIEISTTPCTALLAAYLSALKSPRVIENDHHTS